MEARSVAGRLFDRGSRWRLWALVPILLLVGAVSLVTVAGGPLLDLLGRNPPPADEFDIRRVEFGPGEVRIRVTNPQADALTIASVTVDDAIVPFELEGPATLERLRSATVIVPYNWVEDEPISVGITSSSGIETTEEIPAAVETPGPSAQGFLGYGLVGILVGIVPVALGLMWLPSLRRAAPEWLAAFMAFTGGLLTFLALEALAEALELQAALPGALGGTGLVLLGVATSYLALTFLSQRLAAGEGAGPGGLLGGVALATLVAVGIGLHNLGEGLAVGAALAAGEAALGTALVLGFALHNTTEGLAIVSPLGGRGTRPSLWHFVAFGVLAGAPAIIGAWLGGFAYSATWSTFAFGLAAGAIAQVVWQIGKTFAGRRAVSPAPAGIGLLVGLAVMYLTGLIAA